MACLEWGAGQSRAFRTWLEVLLEKAALCSYGGTEEDFVVDELFLYDVDLLMQRVLLENVVQKLFQISTNHLQATFCFFL